MMYDSFDRKGDMTRQSHESIFPKRNGTKKMDPILQDLFLLLSSRIMIDVNKNQFRESTA